MAELEPFRVEGTEEHPQTVQAEDVLEAIAEGRDIDIDHAVIDGAFDIGQIGDHLERDKDGRWTIRGGIRIGCSRFSGQVTFIEATFSGKADFRGATFSGSVAFSVATFSERADFREATFSGSAGFREATFSEEADFIGATFSEEADFNVATFSGSASFIEATFSEEADFIGATFSEEAVFIKATFNRRADFIEATFSGEAVFFSVAAFSKRADFSGATFSGKVVFFSGATFSRRAGFFRATFSGEAYFSEAVFSERADFRGATFRELATFENVTMERPASFAEVRFRENKVLAGLWNNILHPICRPVVWALTIGKIKLPKRMVTDFSGFNTQKVMDGSSNPYLKRYINDEQWIASWRSRGWLQEAWFRVWELTSHCGRSIGLWAFWSLLLAFLFALAYTPSPDWMPEGWCGFWQKYGAEFEQMAEAYADKPMGFWSSFYFSIVTFTTLGFGDVATANTFARFLVTLEVVLGYIMLGGLISLFANKLARRA